MPVLQDISAASERLVDPVNIHPRLSPSALIIDLHPPVSDLRDIPSIKRLEVRDPEFVTESDMESVGEDKEECEPTPDQPTASSQLTNEELENNSRYALYLFQSTYPETDSSILDQFLQDREDRRRNRPAQMPVVRANKCLEVEEVEEVGGEPSNVLESPEPQDGQEGEVSFAVPGDDETLHGWGIGAHTYFNAPHVAVTPWGEATPCGCGSDQQDCDSSRDYWIHKYHAGGRGMMRRNASVRTA
ncbi:hypothetical protein L873DRAFT_1845366 [Choiromyces venosus 120613-1]|uniref:Uncharacterized protein n=1 Tax=Choiromyces venosus 120613-1 TaxID=1336337 RepID=A0A3N4JDS2_9PEZI|nr:hypothetical protein L873DRAFT_1845366 [Choiromyces venosus 120613-1]